MKKLFKSKTFLGALLSIALCVSLIAGATFAIFTSEANVNIAVTSGTVKVDAKADKLTLYSPTAIDRDGNVLDDENAATANNFSNGGSALLSGNTLTLDNITPGDRADFQITLSNLGNVKTLYRYGYAVKPLTGDDLTEAKKLYSVLEFKLEEVETKKYASYMTAWSEFTESKTLNISVGMSAAADSDYAGLSAKIVFTVEAVQGNVAVGTGEQFEIADEQGFMNAIDMINKSEESSATLVLASDMDLSDINGTSIAIAEDKDVTIDLSGKNLTLKNDKTDGITVNSGATLTLANSKTTGTYTFDSAARGCDGFFVSSSEEGKTTTLNITGNVDINVAANANSAIHAYAPKGNAVVNIDGATVNITGEKQTSAIVMDQNATLNIQNATVNVAADFDSYSENNDVVGILLWGQNGKQENISVNIGDGAVINVGGKNAFAQGIQIGMKNGYSQNLTVTMNGGEIILNPTENGTGYAFATYKASYGKFIMNGGKISGNLNAIAMAYIADTVYLTVTGGVVESNASKSSLMSANYPADENGIYGVVTGGTFAIDPTKYVADGYKVTESNGVWTVTKA